MPAPDASPGWRRAVTAFVLFGGVGLVFLLGAGVLGLSGPTAARSLLGAVHGPWALPAVVAGFALLAFVGAPQFVLVAAVAAAYGPWLGMAYSWVGVLVSALVGFVLARAWRGRRETWSIGPTADRLMTLIARNGVVASLVIRLVPFAPFIVVNMAAGLTGIGLADFLLGTAIGIVPKIVLTALATGSAARLARGDGWGSVILLLLLAGGIWLLISAAARRWLGK